MNALVKKIRDNSNTIFIVVIILLIFLNFTKQSEPEIILVSGNTKQEFERSLECASEGCKIFTNPFTTLSKVEIIESVRTTNSVECCRTINYWVGGILKQRERCREFEENQCPTNWHLNQ